MEADEEHKIVAMWKILRDTEERLLVPQIECADIVRNVYHSPA